MIPNVVDEMGLDAYSFRLYFHIVRIAGIGGECWKSTTQLVEECGISRATVVRCKRRLEKAGLITIRESYKRSIAARHVITPVDIWAQNTTHFADAVQPSANEPVKPKPVVPEGLPDPSVLTVKDIRALDLSKDDWQKLLDLERAGKNRKTAMRAIRQALSSPPPAVKAYRSAAELWPKKSLWPTIAKAVGNDPADLKLWQQVVQGYILKGWNPRNISRMLEYYDKRQIPGGGSAVSDKSNGKAMDWKVAWQEIYDAFLNAPRTSTPKISPLAMNALRLAGYQPSTFRDITNKELPFARNKFRDAYQEVASDR